MEEGWLTSHQQRGVGPFIPRGKRNGARVFAGELPEGEDVVASGQQLDLVQLVGVQQSLVQVPFHIAVVAGTDSAPEGDRVALQALHILQLVQDKHFLT